MKMEDVVPQARRVQHQGQVASSVITERLHRPRTHMVSAAFLIGVDLKYSVPAI